jgi:hypothetical protein
MAILLHKLQLDALLFDLEALTPLSLIADEDVLPDDQCDQIVLDANQISVQLRSLIEQIRLVDDQLSECRLQLAPLCKQLTADLSRTRRVKQMRLLLDLFKKVKFAHDQLTIVTGTPDKDQGCLQGIKYYELLLEVWNELKPLPVHSSLCQYVHNAILHWNTQLKQRVEPLFDQSLKAVGWPKVGGLGNVSKASLSDSLIPFREQFEALLTLEAQQFEGRDGRTMTQKVFANSNVCLPMQRMLIPLKKRFAFHFCHESKTNRSDKPEWYLTQILTWIRNHDEFLENHVESILKNSRFKFMAAKVTLKEESER